MGEADGIVLDIEFCSSLGCCPALIMMTVRWCLGLGKMSRQSWYRISDDTIELRALWHIESYCVVRCEELRC